MGGYEFCRACHGQGFDDEEGGVSASVFEYDPVSDTYTAKQDMPTPRGPGGTAVFEGKIYTFGGNDPKRGDVRLDVVEVYDPAIDAWTTLSPMPMTRMGVGIAVFDDRIYVMGGEQSADQRLDEADIYDPATDSWAAGQVPPLSGMKSHMSVEVVNDRIYVIGGWDGSDLLGTVEVFEPVPTSTAVEATSWGIVKALMAR